LIYKELIATITKDEYINKIIFTQRIFSTHSRHRIKLQG
jgi:hypothetical protein